MLCPKPGGDQGGAGSPGRRQDGGSAPAERPAAPETAVDCSLSQPLVPADLEGPWHGSLGLGSVSEPERSRGAGVGPVGTVSQAVFSLLAWFLAQGELYFMSTGVPSAAAARGVVYKVIDPSR